MRKFKTEFTNNNKIDDQIFNLESTKHNMIWTQEFESAVAECSVNIDSDGLPIFSIRLESDTDLWDITRVPAEALLNLKTLLNKMF